MVAGAIITGRLAKEKLPVRMRGLLSGEYGANDGLAYPLVFLPLLMLEHSGAEAWRRWFLETWLWDVGAALAVGMALGWVVGRLLRLTRRHDLLAHVSGPTVSVALALFAVSSVKLMGSDGILAAFVAGLMMKNASGAELLEENSSFHESMQRFFELSVFFLLGVALPVENWIALGWPLVGMVVATLLFRRIPLFLPLSRVMPEVKGGADRQFVSWFGPIGVAALYYAMFSLKHGEYDLVWPITSAVICGSAVAHGVSATPSTQRYRDPATVPERA